MGFRRHDHRRHQRGPQQRVNHRIRVPEVRVIDAAGDMLGVMTTQDALRMAREGGLDLVEINPKAVPPVCKILDYGKYKYEEKKKASETKRKQATTEVKEVKLRPKTDDHDLDFKARAARRFLEDGNKVKFTVRFRGREIAHPQKAREQLVWITEQVRDISNVETQPAMEGRTMTMMVAPKPQILQALAAARAQTEKERKEAIDARRDGARKSSSGLEQPAESSAGAAESSAGATESSAGATESSAGEAESSAGEPEGSAGEAKGSDGVDEAQA